MIGVLFVLLVGGCIAVVGTAANQAGKAIESAAASPDDSGTAGRLEDP